MQETTFRAVPLPGNIKLPLCDITASDNGDSFNENILIH